VSFAALPVGASQYLIETGPLLHYLSLERDLVQPATEEAKRGGLLVVANPAFGRSDGPASTTSLKPVRGLQTMCSDLGSMRFDPLPATSSEAARVVNQWTHANGGEGILSLVGAAASESAFKASAPGHRVIHLATHGFFLGDQCVPALDSSVAASQRRESRRITTDNPLLLSGLALADANLRNAARPNEEDGVVTAEEIAALNFSGVQWVVLSGCDTGVGQIRSSEGVFGLTRAFRIAGAATIIMSLWPVEDGATEQWMGILYDQRLQKGVGTAEAVHAASLGMLRTQRSSNRSSHPFYWAGFVATGDWH